MKAATLSDSGEVVVILTKYEAEALVLAASLGEEAARKVHDGRSAGSLERTLQALRKTLKPRTNSVFDQ